MDEDHSEHAVPHRPGAVSSKFCPKQFTHPRDAQEVKPPKPARKRNVIVVNDIEIELDDDDDEEDNEPPAPVAPSSSGADSGLYRQLPLLSLGAARNPGCTKNLKPPETKTSTETKAPCSATSGHLSRPVDVGDSGFALHAPLRFKRRAPSIDNSSNFTYTGQS
jgi:hypothetical protein